MAGMGTGGPYSIFTLTVSLPNSSGGRGSNFFQNSQRLTTSYFIV